MDSTRWVWAAAGTAIGCAAGVLAVLPFRPQAGALIPAVNARTVPAVVWHDASKPMERGDLRIEVAGAKVGKTWVNSLLGGSQTPTDGLEVTIEVYNVSLDRKADCRVGNPSLSFARDDKGNRYASRMNEIGTPYNNTVNDDLKAIYPQQRIRLVYVFEPPVEAAEVLYVEIPNGDLGGTEPIRFQIPANSLQRY